jgi:energy-coupling factor transport system ATP-binding protein
VEPILRFENVAFRHRGAHAPALDGVDLELFAGETVVLLGASGAGKSTLCLAADGLVPHFVKGEFSGRVLVGGRDTRQHPPRTFADLVGVIFQDFESQLFCTTAELEAAFGPENLALPRPEIRRRVGAALALTGLAGMERRSPATLSGGQKQRLAIAAALSLEPRVLAFDEPTSDLDPAGKEEVHAVARSLGAQRAAALLIAEPDTEEGARADRVALIHAGKIALAGPPGEVLARVEDLVEAGIRPPPAADVTLRLGLRATVDPAEAATRILAAGYRIRRDRLPAAVPAASGGNPALAARALSFAYPGCAPALSSVDLEIRPGDLVAILGQNGSGKSTLAKLLAGLLKPSSGMVLADGRDLATLGRAEAGRFVGFVFQNPDHQIFAETVGAEVAFGPRLQGLPDREVEERVEESLAAVGLLGQRGVDPFLLSKGGRQRVAVASVLATRPEALILDEPTTGLDATEIREMMRLVERLNGRGHTVVVITHAMWVAAEHARRVVVLAGGRVIADGPPERIFHDEGTLRRTALRPPAAALLARRLGLDAVSAETIVAALERA